MSNMVEGIRSGWYVLKDTGRMHALGGPHTFESAEAAADKIEGGTLWLVDDESAEQWRDTLNAATTPKEMGTTIPKTSLIMTVHAGEAGNGTREYGLATNLSGSPVIESKTSGKRYSFKWEHLIDYAVQRGIDLE